MGVNRVAPRGRAFDCVVAFGERTATMDPMRRPHAIRLLSLLGASVLLAASTNPAAARSVPGAPTCPVFPSDNVWNKRVDQLPVRGDSHTLVASIGSTLHLHPDFSDSDGAGYGIPYNVVGHLAPRYHVTFQWPAESDPGPYPIPANVKIEGGSDRHILVVDRDSCKLYELFAAVKKSDGWHAGSGAIWNLTSNALRPKGWTSADAAGLPILPGLVRYDEVAAGVITHALRFTADTTRTSFIYPARHQAGDSASVALRRWACASASRPTSTSAASGRSRASCSPRSSATA